MNVGDLFLKARTKYGRGDLNSSVCLDLKILKRFIHSMGIALGWHYGRVLETLSRAYR